MKVIRCEMKKIQCIYLQVVFNIGVLWCSRWIRKSLIGKGFEDRKRLAKTTSGLIAERINRGGFELTCTPFNNRDQDLFPWRIN